jgi:apolipoprotein N-acyltransferase
MITAERRVAGDGGRTSLAARLEALAGRVGALAGWRRAALAVAFGLAATAALPPLHVIPLVVIAFSGLLWLVEGAASRRAAFFDGWWFGFGHFAAGLYWLAHALLVDAQQFGWMIPFAVFGLAAVLGVFTGAATQAVHAVRARGVAAALVLAVAWTAAEWLRGHVLTGFPWNLIGTVWTGLVPLMQPTAIVGLYGLGLLTVLVAGLPATRRWPAIGAAIALVAIGLFWGAARIPETVATVPDVKLRLVQPNIPQTLKWDPVQREANFRRTLALTASAGLATRTHVIWPETAVPFAITDVNPNGPALRAALAGVTPPGGLLLAGAVRVVRDGERPQLWNSLHALDASGAIVATYDKHHLVPFGEYVPLRGIIGRLGVTPAGAVDFSPGPGPATLDLPGLPPASPLICYEAIFPTRVADNDRRPGWLLNITNDAWFGISSGPYQHFAAARFRAVEEGLPLVRVANNGISAVVDAYGRAPAQLGLGTTGVLDVDLPAAAVATPYARWGDVLLLGLALLGLAMAAVIGRLGADKGNKLQGIS